MLTLAQKQEMSCIDTYLDVFGYFLESTIERCSRNNGYLLGSIQAEVSLAKPETALAGIDITNLAPLQTLPSSIIVQP